MPSPPAEANGSPGIKKSPEECRLCLDPCDEFCISIENTALLNKIEKVFHFPVTFFEQLPSGVCENCTVLINEFFKYSEKVRLNQERLIAGLATALKPEQTEEIKQESPVDSIEAETSIEINGLPPTEEEEKEDCDGLGVFAVELDDSTRKRTRRKRKYAIRERSTSPEVNDEEFKSKLPARKYNVKSREEHEKDEQRISEFYRMVCDLCGAAFNNFSSLDLHFRDDHDRSGYVICCNKKIYKRRPMVEHMMLHSDPSAYRCEICNKNYKSKVYLAMHQVKQHGSEEDRPFKCDRCKQSFAKSYHLRAHMVAHEKVQCPKCDRMLASKMALSTHLSNMHSDKDRRMICDSCGKEFLNKTCFEQHVKEHKGIEVHPMLECHICHKSLKGERNLQKHIRYTHDETEQTHVCDICQQNYPNSRALWSHKRAVHVEEKFECEFCGKRFKRAVNLKEHRTIHTGEVLYACEYCGATMNSNANLYTHVKKNHPVEYAEKRQQAASSNSLRNSHK